MQFEWSATAVPKGNSDGNLFNRFDVDSYYEACNEYNRLNQNEKAKYKGKLQFLEVKHNIILSPHNKSYLLLREELDARFNNPTKTEEFKLGQIISDNILFELLASIENEAYIRSIYKDKKRKVSSTGLSQKEATVIMDCMRQGRSLLEAGKKADILAKPLIDFYAASAYAYAVIVLNSPLHKSLSSLKGSHGHTYDHENGILEFGGCTSRGTFLDLMGAVFTNSVSYNSTEAMYSLLDSIDFLQRNTISLSLMTLFSMVPEIQKFYIAVDKEKSHYLVHKLTFDNEIVGNDTVNYNFYIGDGSHKAQGNILKECFQVNEIKEKDNSYQLTVSGKSLKNINPMIYQDICGGLWYVEMPIVGLNIPEICLHYLIISALSNIMRYSPQDWNSILNNKESTEFSLLVRRYIWLFEKKFPMLVVKFLTNYLPVYSSDLW